MFGSGWTAVGENERGGLAGPLPAGATVERLVLPFYETFSLMRIDTPVWGAVTLPAYYLADESDAVRLDGTSPPLHDVNAIAPLRLDVDNVLEYLKFYCYFVRGEEGPFLIVESDSDALGVGEHLRNTVGHRVFPATRSCQNRRGAFECEAMVLYGGTLFQCRFEVQPSGKVDMDDDEPLAETGIHVEAPL